MMTKIKNFNIMENSNLEDQKYRKAKKKVKNIKGFYIHFGVFLLVNTIVFLVVNLIDGDLTVFWEYYPIAGWVIALAIHFYAVFGFNIVFGKDWEQKRIKDLMDKYN